MEKDGVRVSTEPARVPEIVRALVGAQIDVFALDTQEAHSLEDVFIKVTGEEQQNG